MCYAKLRVLACLAVLTISAAARAEIVYEDATPLNTSPSSAIVTSGDENDTDNLWFQRSQSACEGGTILTSQAGPEDSPLLTTTVSGLANGAYNVYAVYWSNDVGNWTIQAAISGQSLAAYNGSNGTWLRVDDGNRSQYAALLGTVNVADGSLSIDVDDYPPAGSVTDGRAWYDGVAYQAVPEPSTALMLAVGMLGLLAYAWRKQK